MKALKVVHSLYAIVGCSTNLALLTIILTTKRSGLNSYAVITFNIACVDIVEIVLDAFIIPRLIGHRDEVVLVFHGYCTTFGPEVCFRSHMVMLHLVFFSLFLIAYSFWHRYNVLVKDAPSPYAVQLFAMFLFLPNALSTVIFFFAKNDPRLSYSILHSIYPTMNVNATCHRSFNFFDPFSAPTDFYAVIMPFVVYTFIVVMRRKVLITLSSLAQNMSWKTKQMHFALITTQALTYHAILPSTICIGINFYFLQIMGVYSPIVDSMIFAFLCIPAVVNPCLTLYFVAPYRRRVLRAIGREQAIATLSLASSSDAK